MKNMIQIKYKKLGYTEALDLVFKIRAQRQKIYGDKWKQDPEWMLFPQIYQKTLRLKTFIIDKNTEKSYENEIDTLCDLINYSLFLLQNKLDAKKDKKHVIK